MTLIMDIVVFYTTAFIPLHTTFNNSNIDHSVQASCDMMVQIICSHKNVNTLAHSKHYLMLP